MVTVAEQLGQTPHLSPLLRRLRRLGLGNPDDLRRLAAARGCTHYRRPGDAPPFDPAPVSNAELAVGMISAAQQFDPVLVRCAAQLLGDDRISVDDLIRLAVHERAVPVLRHIAQAGATLDPDHAEKWQRLLTDLPAGAAIAAGRLPHPSRFTIESGVSRQQGRLVASGRKTWLRPQGAPGP